MIDVISLGTVFADFTHIEENKLVQDIGGSTANLSIACSRLGLKSAFIGKIGDDNFGAFARDTLKSENVDVTNLVTDVTHQTPVTFIDHEKRGSEKYTFYRHDSADMYLKYNEVRKKLIDECKIFHFESLTLVANPSYEATVKAVHYARSKNKIISYDANYRKSLWKNTEEANKKLTELLNYCDIVKFSQEEFTMITGSENLVRGVANLLKIGVKIVLISQGANGCVIATRKFIRQIPTHKIEIVDTTGSGDAFLACFMYKLLDGGKKLEEYSSEELCSFATFSNAGATLCAMDFGSVSAMANVQQINEFMKKNKV